MLTLTQPVSISVEPFGVKHPLHIFANPPEIDAPAPGDKDVIYFGPGEHFVDNPVRIPDNTTVYLAGGAVLKSNFVSTVNRSGTKYYGYDYSTIPATFDATWAGGVRKKNITIRGRGIVCGRHTFEQRQRHKMVTVQFADYVKLEGVIFRESSGWNLFLDHSSHVHVDNVKIVRGPRIFI